ncbi:MAG: amino acid permease [Candidatus Acidiferrales bacterium]
MNSLPPETSNQSLPRQLGLGFAAAAVAGECIAVGIFLTPAGMAKSLGSPFWLLIAWLVMGFMALTGALCYGELAATFPQTGGSYIYLQRIFGSRIAFLYGWMLLLVLDPGLTAALAVGVAAYIGFIAPLSALHLKLLALCIIWLLCAINRRSTRMIAGLVRWTTWLKFAVLPFIAIWAIAFRLGAWSNFVPFVTQRPGSAPLGAAFAGAMVAAFFSFGGWWDVTKLSGEVHDPARTLPRALVIGVVAVTAVYVIVSAVFLYLVPLARVTSDQTFVAQAGVALFGSAGGVIFSAVVVLCILGSLTALTFAAPRVYFAMAADGLFLPSVGRPHPRYGTPSRAVVIQACVASVLVIVGSFDRIIAYFIFVAVVFLALCVAGLFVMRRRSLNVPAVCTPGYPATPIAFLVLVAALLVMIAMHSPREAAIGTVVVLLGWPVYDVFRRGSA